MTARPRVLYVDSERQRLAAFESAFGATYNTKTAEDGAQALKLAGELSVDVVIIAFELAGITGVDLLERFAQIQPAALRVLAVAAEDAVRSRDVIEHLHIDNRVAWPLAEAEVSAVIARAMEFRRGWAREDLRLRWMVGGSPDGVMILDEDGRLRMVNKRLCRMTRRDDADLVGASVESVVPGVFDLLKSGAHQLTEGEGRTLGVDSSLTCQPRVGGKFPVEITASVQILDEQRRWVVAVRDVSIQRKLARALMESEEKLQIGQALAGIGYWEEKHQSGTIAWSEWMYVALGVDPGGFDGSFGQFVEYIHPEDRGRFVTAYTAQLAGGESLDLGFRLVRPDGEERHVHCRCLTDYDDAGRAVRTLGTIQDMTERRLAEIELEHNKEHLQDLVEARTVELWAAHEEVHRSEELHRMLLENISAGVLVCDMEGRVEYCNRQMGTILESVPGDLKGRSLGDFDSPGVAGDVLKPLWARMISPVYESAQPVVEEDFPIVPDGGARRWLKGNSFPVIGPGGEMREVVTTVVDITESKRVEVERQRDEARLWELLELSKGVSETAEEIQMEALVLESALRLTESPIGYFHYFDEKTGLITSTFWSGRVLKERSPLDRPGIWAEAVQLRKPVIHNHYLTAEGAKGLPEGYSRVRRHMSVPVFDGGRIVAVLGVGNKQDPYEQADAWQLTQLMGTAMSFIHRFEAERAMRESEEKYRALVTEITDGFYTTDARGNIDFANDAFARILRFDDPSDIVGAPLWNLLQKSRRDSVESHYLQGVNTGVFETEIESEVVRADGTSGYVEIHPAPIYDGGLVVGSRGVVRDVTDRRASEAEMRKLSRAVGASPVVVMITDREGRIEYVNPKFTEVTGYSAEEVIGRNPRVLSADVHEREFYEELWATILTGQVWHGEFCNRRKNGETLWENTSISPIRGDSGEITHFVAVKEDVTEARRAAEALRDAKDAADTANRAKSAFLANMSHEIRTPMNAILGYAQLMQRTGELNDQQKEFLQTINRSGEHLLVLINDVLEMSKIEAGQAAVANQTFDLFGLLDEVERMFLERTRSKGLEFGVAKSDNLPRYLFGDEGKVRQVLINVVGNAVKFTEAGHVHIRASGDVCVDGRYLVVIEVEDTGPGIASDEVEHIFEPFAQTDVGRRHGGSGLGMAISRKFADQLDGVLTVTSAVDHGSLFRFEFKAQPQSRVDLISMPPPRRAVGLVPGYEGKRILVVDDQATNRDVLVHILTPLGFVVDQVADGQEALSAIIKWMPDVVLMDMQMPVMDGKEATRRIRLMPNGRDVPILMVTASAMEEDREEALISGADGFIRKPYREDEILAEINRVTGVQYVFERGEASLGAPRITAPIIRQSINRLPQELVDELKAAIEDGDMERFAILNEQVGLTDAQLAIGLARMAAGFEYDQLLDLLDLDTQGDD